ncbi:hypothetical protein ISR94_03835 [Candidatus Microgenomates bacterium]|nr:hypothetical protein [Candidatus Microgenomates bacterium]
MKLNIRLLYLYLFSFIGLLIAVIGTVQIVDLGLKTYIFKQTDTYEFARPVPLNDAEVAKVDPEEQKAMQDQQTKSQRQRQASNALAMIIVGIPLYKYHWSLIQKQSKKK